MMEIQRKTPTQPRSKAAVQAILEATTHLLLAKGAKRLTTNHIAELAGVSIGSLYQYFTNKEAIVAKLTELYVEEEVTRVSILMTRIRKSSTCKQSIFMRERNIRLVMQEFIDIHTENLELAQILHTQIDNQACRQALRNTTTFLTKLVQDMLDHVDGITRKGNNTRAYIISNSIDLLIQTTLIEQPELFTKPEFLDELVNLCMSYLK
ncbi:Transcriptional regulator, AcrR family [hydrothermal vent metagenome]|uniref:Transcriptional regulator, AcrR family n=1 Tax=hydrothermal vent metagenome TaxID=652676 RepID=A0A3B0W0P3_9ZZZZ